jgi:(2Fe-2S) ferredoxin
MNSEKTGDRQVLVCQYVNCQANDSEAVLKAFQAENVENVEIVASGCQGQCNMGATVRVLPDDIWYCRIKPDQVPQIVRQHLQAGKPVAHLMHPRMHPQF